MKAVLKTSLNIIWSLVINDVQLFIDVMHFAFLLDHHPALMY